MFGLRVPGCFGAWSGGWSGGWSAGCCPGPPSTAAKLHPKFDPFFPSLLVRFWFDFGNQNPPKLLQKGFSKPKRKKYKNAKSHYL